MTGASVTAEKDFGRRLRERRVGLGITQREVAADMRARGFDWHQPTVAKTEAGTRPLRLNEAVAIAELMVVPLVAAGIDPSEGPAARGLQLVDALTKVADIARTALTGDGHRG